MVDGQMEKEQLSAVSPASSLGLKWQVRSSSLSMAETDRQGAFNWLPLLHAALHTQSTVLGDECVACLHYTLVYISADLANHM